jgi:YD repeat-containing protein
VRTDITRGPGVGGTTVQTLAWDGLSRLVGATDNNDPASPGDDSVLDYVYDSLSRVAREAHGGRDIARDRDGAGNITAVTYADGTSLTFAYDPLNRVREVRDGAGAIVTYDYFGPWRLWRQALGGAAVAEHAYDAARRLIGLSYRLDAGPSTIAAYTYSYDRAGRRVTETVQPGNRRTTYTYDSAGQLTSARSPSGEYAYTYDAAGNLTAIGRGGLVDPVVVDTVNAYASIGGLPQAYDANGNLLRSRRIRRSAPDSGPPTVYLPLAMRPRATGATIAAPPSGRVTRLAATGAVTETVIDYRYDFKNRVIGVTRSVTVTTGTGHEVHGGTYGFAYDARDRQVMARGSDGERWLGYVGGQLAEERDGSGNLVARYVGTLAVDRSSRRTYLLGDAVGTIRLVVGATGAPEAVFEYEPFGALIPHGDPGGTPASSLLFHGHRIAAGGSFYALGARAYDPDTGRHVQRSRSALGPTYLSAGNDPVNVVEH